MKQGRFLRSLLGRWRSSARVAFAAPVEAPLLSPEVSTLFRLYLELENNPATLYILKEKLDADVLEVGTAQVICELRDELRRLRAEQEVLDYHLTVLVGMLFIYAVGLASPDRMLSALGFIGAFVGVPITIRNKMKVEKARTRRRRMLDFLQYVECLARGQAVGYLLA